jgi:hypothetical protein
MRNGTRALSMILGCLLLINVRARSVKFTVMATGYNDCFKEYVSSEFNTVLYYEVLDAEKMASNPFNFYIYDPSNLIIEATGKAKGTMAFDRSKGGLYQFCCQTTGSKRVKVLFDFRSHESINDIQGKLITAVAAFLT